MPSRVLRTLTRMDLEEQILSASALTAIVAVFLPWFAGEWLNGEQTSFNGTGYYTGLIGWGVLLLHVGILLLTLVPSIIRPGFQRTTTTREALRLILSLQAIVLLLAVLTVYLRTQVDFPRMGIRFGHYVCLAATVLTMFESFTRFIAHRRLAPQEAFGHPDMVTDPSDLALPIDAPPPPPPPPPPDAEDHRF